MRTETLKVVKKTIVKAEYGRCISTYYRYVVKNGNHSLTLRTGEDTKLFNLLQENVVHKHATEIEILIDVVYKNNKFLMVKNPRLNK